MLSHRPVRTNSNSLQYFEKHIKMARMPCYIGECRAGAREEVEEEE
jgi:hypothetical protein